MSVVLLFLVLLILMFGVIVYLLKPTAMEKAVEDQLASIEDGQTAGGEARTSILKDRAVKANALDDFAASLPWSEATSRLIKQAGMDWPLGYVFLFSLVGAVVTYGLTAWLNLTFLLCLVLAAAVAVAPYFYLVVNREIRFRQISDLLPEAVDLMSRGLRAGHSIQAVLEMVGNEISDPVGIEFRALHKEQTLGLPIREAMMKLVDRVPVDDMRFLATAILLQKESGGNLAQILDKTAAVIRERARLRGQLRIYTAQGRITGWILGGAPFFIFAMLNLIKHDYEMKLLTDPLGLKMVYFALGMMVIGILAIRKIIDIKV